MRVAIIIVSLCLAGCEISWKKNIAEASPVLIYFMLILILWEGGRLMQVVIECTSALKNELREVERLLRLIHESVQSSNYELGKIGERVQNIDTTVEYR